jgi:hypothetical protein
MGEMEYEESPQEVAARRRALGVGKAISDTARVKFDKVRGVDFRTSNIILMERTLGKKSWQIIQEFRMGGWGQEDLMGVLWAGLLKDNPEVTIHDAYAIWDATPYSDRTKALTQLSYALIRALGVNIDQSGEIHSEESKK